MKASSYLTVVAMMSMVWAGEARADYLTFDSFYLGTTWSGQLSLTGRELNGVSLGGEPLDGRIVSHASLSDVEIDGRTLADARVEASVFEGRTQRGRRYRGSRFVGALFTARLADGGVLRLRIDDVERGRERHDRDILRYAVSYASAEGWRPLCGLDADGEPIRAIPLAGRWDLRQGVSGGGDWIDDPDAVTFGCVTHVLAHCVEAGYAPWRRARLQRRGPLGDLRAHHQACTRMMRADYCGDGTPHTVNGVEVNVYDGLGVRLDSEDWLFEAEWDEDGALCMVEERLAGELPSCVEALVDPRCGDPGRFREGTLLFSEVAPD